VVLPADFLRKKSPPSHSSNLSPEDSRGDLQKRIIQRICLIYMQFSRGKNKSNFLLACCVSHSVDDCYAEEGAEDDHPAVAVFSLLLFLLLE
jgi:hypothetical protein